MENISGLNPAICPQNDGGQIHKQHFDTHMISITVKRHNSGSLSEICA